MIIVLKQNSSEDDINEIVTRLTDLGLDAHISRGEHHTIVGVIGDEAILANQPIQAFPSVETVVRITKPYKLAARANHPQDTTIMIGQFSIGNQLAIIAGPGTVESAESALAIGSAIQKNGVDALYSGVYQPRTSPYSFKGLGQKGLQILADTKTNTGLPVATEVLDPRQVEAAAALTDILIIGSQNMQNYELLKEAAKHDKPLILKRGVMNTLEEFLLAAEFILAKGSKNLVLCETGIRTFEKLPGYAVDIRTIPHLKEETHLPIMLDVSHAAADRALVGPTALAAVAAGVDGLLFSVHDNPDFAMVDGNISITPKQLQKIIQKARAIRSLIEGSEQ